MSPEFLYQSDLFDNLPDQSGYLAIYISESRCDIAICSSSFVLVYYERFLRKGEQNQTEFLKELFASKQSLFAKHYQEVNLGVNGSCFTLLPDEFDQTEDSLLKLICGESEAQEFHNALPFLNSKLVYRFADDALQVVNQSFENLQPTHCISHALEMARTTPKYDQLIVIGEQYFDLIVKKDRHIYSVNRHAFEAAEDVTYFTLLGLKDANIHSHDAKVLVTGMCDKSNEIYHNLSEFVGKVEIKKVNETVTIRSDFDQPHQYAEYALNLLHANY